MVILLAGIGIALFLEGAIYALNPEGMKKLAALAAHSDADQLRWFGLGAAVIGAIITFLSVS